MSATFLAFLDLATRHGVKVASVGAKGAAAGVAVTLDDVAVTAGKPKSAGIPQDQENAFVLGTAAVSAKNKLWQYPLLLGIVAVAPPVMAPLLGAGALYLCYEGWHETHDLAHHHLHKGEPHHTDPLPHEGDLDDGDTFSPDHMKAVMREAQILDLVLSAEIGVMALNAMGAGADFKQAALDYELTGSLSTYLPSLATHAPAIALVGAAATLGVYLPVWIILRADNWAEFLMARQGTHAWARLQRTLGQKLVPATHSLMRALPYVGTAAMLAVGGHIMINLVPAAHHSLEDLIAASGLAGVLVEYSVAIAAGLITGFLFDKLILPPLRPLYRLVSQKIFRQEKLG
ncbi:MAG: DUF808 family protein [Pseudomonadota bacterium]